MIFVVHYVLNVVNFVVGRTNDDGDGKRGWVRHVSRCLDGWSWGEGTTVAVVWSGCESNYACGDEPILAGKYRETSRKYLAVRWTCVATLDDK